MKSNCSGIAIECFEAEKLIAATSGIKICKHFCICHGSLLSQFVIKYLKLHDHLKPSSNLNHLGNEVTKFLCDLDLQFKIYEPYTKLKQTGSYKQFPGFLEKLIVNSRALKIFQQLLTSEKWSFDKKSPENVSASVETISLSSFLLIRLSVTGGSICSCLQFFESKTCQPVVGEVVFIDGCPFGGNNPALFLNSISRGIVGNITSNGEIFLTDARCSLGCEGAPVFAQRHKEFLTVCGLVISPFCWIKGEWVGLSFVASIKPLIHNLLSSEKASNSSLSEDYQPTPSSTHIVELISQCVVRIHTEDEKSWGSGVIVNGAHGIVVTCSHVLPNFHAKEVFVSFIDDTKEIGKVIFKNKSPESGSLLARDIAIIQISPQKQSIALSRSLPDVGTQVMIVGFPFFPKSLHNSPTFSSGNLAKTYESFAMDDGTLLRTDPGDGEYLFRGGWKSSPREICTSSSVPILLQTTCGSYGGVSGAPVVALHPLRGPIVIGIMSCSLRDKDNNTFFPGFSFATPSWLLAQAVDRFILTKDVKELDLLNKKSERNACMSLFENEMPAKL